MKTGDCPNARKTLQGHDGRFRCGRVWGSAPSCAGSSSKPVSPAGLPSLCFQRACQRCPSVLELFPRIDFCTCSFLAAQGFHVESNVKSVILVRRKRFVLKKQPIQLFLSYMGKSTQAQYCSCFALVLKRPLIFLCLDQLQREFLRRRTSRAHNIYIYVPFGMLSSR